MASNAPFAAEAQTEYDQNKTGEKENLQVTKRLVADCILLGPLTVGLGSSVVFLPLQDFYSDVKGLITKIEAQDSSEYLPAEYSATSLAGFKAQKNILINSF